MTHIGKFLLVLVALTLATSFGSAQGHMYTKAAPSGPTWTTTATSWVNIEDLDLWFYQYDPGNVCLGISAEVYSVTGKRIFVRVLVDDTAAFPTDVVFAAEDVCFCRSFQFSATINSRGIHHVTFQTKVDGGGTASFGDRTMWVITSPELVNIAAAPSGANLTTTSSSFEDVSGMGLNIDMPATGPLYVAFSAEVLGDVGKRAFLRAVLDGAAGLPSDVIIANGTYLGVHGMTFVFPSVTSGNHNVKIQWLVDAGGTATMGDRTLAVVAPNMPMLAAGEGGIMSVSAPSGPDVSTTSTGWASVPDLAIDINVPDNATLTIALQGETEVIGGRMFLRATVDGVACSPSDAVLTYQPGFYGTCSMTFVKKNTEGGLRHVAFQWRVDGGATGYLADRNITVVALPCAGPDMTGGFEEVQPSLGTFPLLVLLWDPQRPTHTAPTVGEVTNLIHGSYPSVADYFAVNSNGNATVGNAGILGWFTADSSYSFYWAAEDPTDADGDGFTSGHVRKWWEAITEADTYLDFASYDANGDGVLNPNELGIVIIIPQNTPFGTVRTPASSQYPTWQPLVVDGVRIPLIAEVYAGSPLNLGAFAHEISHLLFNLPDLYFNFFFPYAAGHYSLMDVCYFDSHIDPFLKIHLGWLQPALVTHSGNYTIDPVETGSQAYVLMDPKHGEREYFIVENRQRALDYDSGIADSGLAVWHIMEDPAVYGALAAPHGVSTTNWSGVSAGDWGRRAIRMIRPVYGPPFDNAKALWDGADPATGYDLLSNDPDTGHVELRWADGSQSGFAIKDISAATGTMSAYFELPGTATDVADRSSLPAESGIAQNYPNPFNPTTTLRYTVAGVVAPSGAFPSGAEGPEAGHVRLAVYDLLGREVAVLVDEQKQPGEYTATWDAHGMASGVYFYRLMAGGACETKKMLLLR